MERCLFSGATPVSILNFCSTFRKVPNGDQIAEVETLVIRRNFMDHDAHMFYFLLMNKNAEELGVFRTLPHAMQLLLQTYANDRKLDVDVYTIDNMRMDSSENVNDFYRRPGTTDRDMAGAYSQDD